jgi:4'-phosphopantetheinyl transferase
MDEAELADLGSGEVRVWLTDPDAARSPELLESYQRLLSTDEARRLSRIRRTGPRHSYLVARALLRVTLSRYAPVEPAAWRFQVGEHGRPEICAPDGAAWLRFNLSHTDGLVACAMVREHDIGVDVEAIDRPTRTLKLAERFFSASEADDLRSLDPDSRAQRFVEYWTLKEAYLKARGAGLTLPLRGAAFELPASGEPRARFDPQLADDPDHWQFALRRPTGHHRLSLAVRRGLRTDCAIRMEQSLPLADRD